MRGVCSRGNFSRATDNLSSSISFRVPETIRNEFELRVSFIIQVSDCDYLLGWMNRSLITSPYLIQKTTIKAVIMQKIAEKSFRMSN